MSESLDRDLQDPKLKITDAFNNLLQFSFSAKSSLEEIKESIRDAHLKTVEEYTGLSREALEDAVPGICAEFNAIRDELVDSNLGERHFRELMARAKSLAERQ